MERSKKQHGIFIQFFSSSIYQRIDETVDDADEAWKMMLPHSLSNSLKFNSVVCCCFAGEIENNFTSMCFIANGQC